MTELFVEIVEDLRRHLAVCTEVLAVVEQESQELRRPESSRLPEVAERKRRLLPVLSRSLERVRFHRVQWQKVKASERDQAPEIPPLLRQNQDLIMKIIVLDRENEQLLLRQGLIPARQLPAASRQRPHFVADLYRRQDPR